MCIGVVHRHTCVCVYTAMIICDCPPSKRTDTVGTTCVHEAENNSTEKMENVFMLVSRLEFSTLCQFVTSLVSR